MFKPKDGLWAVIRLSEVRKFYDDPWEFVIYDSDNNDKVVRAYNDYPTRRSALYGARLHLRNIRYERRERAKEAKVIR